jgi:large subunit ribosomal protein L25
MLGQATLVVDSGTGLKEIQMAKLSLKANSREITGKRVAALRLRGITPLHLFGHGLKSLALQSETAELEKSLNQAGETRLISLTVDKERTARPVLAREIQRDRISGKLLHVDLYQVKMDEKVVVEVPIVLVGEAPALGIKGSSVLQELDSLTVESLPDKIPANLKLDISSLTEAGQVKRVRDIKVEPGIVVTSNPDLVVVAVVVARAEEKVEEVAATEVAVTPSETESTKEHQERG